MISYILYSVRPGEEVKRPVVTYIRFNVTPRKTRRPTYFDNLKIIKKVLDLYRLLFVYSGLPVCGDELSYILHDTIIYDNYTRKSSLL